MNNEDYLDHLLRVAKLINACVIEVEHQLEGVLSTEEESALINRGVMLQKQQQRVSEQIATTLRSRTVFQAPSQAEIDKVKHYLNGVTADINSVSATKAAAECLEKGLDYIARL